MDSGWDLPIWLDGVDLALELELVFLITVTMSFESGTVGFTVRLD